MCPASIRFSTSPTTATGRCALLRSAIAAGLFNLALDPDHREDQDRSPDLRGGVIDRWAQPPRNRICWKFNDGPHVLILSVVALSRDLRRRPSLRTKRG